MTSAIFAHAAELWAEMKLDWDLMVEMRYQDAESELGPAMLNRAGVSADIPSESLFTGSESRAMKYASEELIEYWATHPRPPRLADYEAKWLEMRRS